MKPMLSLLCSFFSFTGLFAQTNQWAWMSGDSTANQPGVYGTRGTAASTNKPGARAAASSWTDASGNQWLFGGDGYAASGSDSSLNDLWKYAASAGGWTWVSGDSTPNKPGFYGVKGTAASGNRPGARAGAANWTDASGNLWLFGGSSYNDSGSDEYNDVWKYSPSNGEWTWMSGDSITNQPGVYGIKGNAAVANMPGARSFATAWADASGNLWLFGGEGYSAGDYYGYMNDLWKYSLLTGQWTWISGDSLTYNPGKYGMKGMAGSANIPGARVRGVNWTDAAGNLWLFGGSVYPVNSLTELNDLWKFVPATGQWTWVGGDSVLNQKGVYGTKGMAASGNKPGARSAAVSWIDASGNLWLFGGGGFVDYGSGNLYYEGNLSDLWKYMPSTGLWTWVSGDSTIHQTGIYGTKGIAAPGNTPRARGYAVSWTNPSGDLWLFGGFEYVNDSMIILFNDLWRYTIPSGSTLPVQFSSFTAQKQLQTVLLNWSAAREQNSRSFIIERSAAGAVYDSIGNMAARGTTFSGTHYSFTDMVPLPGSNYYRIKQLDQDGRFLYSAVAKVVMDNDAVQFTVIQNPVRNTLQLSIQLPAAQKLVLQVRDISGQLLINEERMGSKGSSVYNIPVSALAKGTYLINMQTGRLSSTKTFIRQ